ncbi:Tetratricopeptide TPR_2 repeat protein [uncultured Pleomorphomonas sp.]|uniref:Tetratricopeptide TPR_2 repeat protein n=2 Tax=uncultured Pleomorphomonas sp. TaxID=442121 RepID=A0A212LMU0_9HYPH|nr:Tetratricopeptide TPR_2 repeat protein [uncultured Pleomorphomonas sp.]
MACLGARMHSTIAAREGTFPGMRVFVPFALLLSIAVGPACADDGLPTPVASGRERLVTVVPADKAAELDGLFARLAAAKDRSEAAGIEVDIRRRWAASGSATGDLMLSWTEKAVAAGDAAGALDILDELTVRQPAFAEAYYRRGTLHLLAGRLSPALGDFQTVLRIEPRHFLAMKDLAVLLEDIDQHDRALEVLRRLQGIDPNFEGLDAAIEAIVAGSHGRDI